MQLQPGLYAHRKRGKTKKKTILAWHRAPIEHCFMPWASQIDDTVIALSANSSAMSLADITFDAIFYVTFVCLCLGMLCSHVSYYILCKCENWTHSNCQKRQQSSHCFLLAYVHNKNQRWFPDSWLVHRACFLEKRVCGRA